MKAYVDNPTAVNGQWVTMDIENQFSRTKLAFRSRSMPKSSPHDSGALAERNGDAKLAGTASAVDNTSANLRVNHSQSGPFYSNIAECCDGPRIPAPQLLQPNAACAVTSAQQLALRSSQIAPHSDEVPCGDIDLYAASPHAEHAGMWWDDNRPSAEFLDEKSLDYDDFHKTIIAPEYNDAANNEAVTVRSTRFDESIPVTTKSTVESCPISPPSPLDEFRRKVAALDGGDAVFNVQLDLVMDKLVYALMDLDSAYLFRDFAGNFTEFLDRFGPGGYDMHRAPPTTEWIFNLLLPLIQAHPHVSETQIRVYAEVCGWLQSMVAILGPRNSEELLNGGTWDRCVEHLSSARIEVSNVAFDTIEVILRNVPLEYSLILKVILMEPFDLTLTNVELCRFRLYRVKLLSVLLERIDSARRAGMSDHYKCLVPEITRALQKLKHEESDLRVTKSIDTCLKYASDTEALFSRKTSNQLSPRARRPHLSLTLSRWQQQELAAQQDSKKKQRPSLFHRLFRRHSNETQLNAEDNSYTPDVRDAMSAQTSRNTRTLKEKWDRLFRISTKSSAGDDDVEIRTVITV